VSCRIVVLISGSGSNLQALIDQLDRAHGEIVAVLSNRADAFGLQRAGKAGIDTLLLNHRDYPDRLSFDRALIEALDHYRPDLVVLAGFMRILSAEFVTHYQGRLLNIHPSLLPNHKGLDTHARALAAGDQEHGATVHFVTEELDGGPLIIQSCIPVLADDTPASLAARVQIQEHRLYPLAVNWFASGRLKLLDGHAHLDGKPVGPKGLRLDNMETDMRGPSDA
jgi:phosphoribosylglycinamide formyltransferase 1